MSELFGPVRTVLELTWEVRGAIRLVLPEELLDRKLYYTKSEYFIYNKEGELVSKTIRDEKDEILRQFEYTYDSDGDLLTEKSVSPKSGTTLEVHEYDQAGQQKIIKSFNEAFSREDQTVCFYDENDLCVKAEEYDSKGELTCTEHYVYDQKGNLIRRTELNRNGEKISESITVYNDHNQRLKSIYTFNDQIIIGRKEKVITYYDEYQNITKEIWFNSEGVIERLSIYEYEFDKYYNWTSLKTIQNRCLILRTERVIEYFE